VKNSSTYILARGVGANRTLRTAQRRGACPAGCGSLRRPVGSVPRAVNCLEGMKCVAEKLTREGRACRAYQASQVPIIDRWKSPRRAKECLPKGGAPWSLGDCLPLHQNGESKNAIENHAARSLNRHPPGAALIRVANLGLRTFGQDGGADFLGQNRNREEKRSPSAGAIVGK
jgi:hypothetical protein